MKTQIIYELWKSYRQEVLPPNASSIQIQECRMAFHAGAYGLFTSLFILLEPGSEPTQADLDLLKGIKAELEDFSNVVKRAGETRPS